MHSVLQVLSVAEHDLSGLCCMCYLIVAVRYRVYVHLRVCDGSIRQYFDAVSRALPQTACIYLLDCGPACVHLSSYVCLSTCLSVRAYTCIRACVPWCAAILLVGPLLTGWLLGGVVANPVFTVIENINPHAFAISEKQKVEGAKEVHKAEMRMRMDAAIGRAPPLAYNELQVRTRHCHRANTSMCIALQS